MTLDAPLGWSDGSLEDRRRFKTGAVVRLVSGGIPMTVSDPLHREPVLIDVIWFDKGQNLKRDCFHQDCLIPYVEKEKKK